MLLYLIFADLAEVLNNLIKNTREMTGTDTRGENFEEFNEPSPSANKSLELAFNDSPICKLAEQAQNFMKKSKFKYATKIHIFKSIGMTKIEFSINCLEMTPTSIESLGLTYDSTVNINFTYAPDVRIGNKILVSCNN
jgi:hypothetical protein